MTSDIALFSLHGKRTMISSMSKLIVRYTGLEISSRAIVLIPLQMNTPSSKESIDAGVRQTALFYRCANK